MQKSSLVSIIILNWNGKKWLAKCLLTIIKTSYPQKEIIVVNNGSTDDSAVFVKKHFVQVKIIELKKNVGYAKANNIGVQHAHGKYILILNNDTTVTVGFLEPMIDAMEKDPSIGVIQPQIRSMIHRNLLDSMGSYLTSTGFLYYTGYMKKHSLAQYRKIQQVYSIKGACFLMRKEDFVTLGGFDEDFFCYVEETDLCHRVWLFGKKVIYFPKSVIYHYGGGDMHLMTRDELILYRSFRNRIISFIKNLSIVEILRILPIHIALCEIYIFSSLLRGQYGRAKGAQLGLIDGFLSIPRSIRKRKIIQRSIRKISDSDLMLVIRRNPRLSYYYYVVNDIGKYKD